MHELGGGEIGLLHRLHKNLVLLLDAILLADVLVVLDVRHLQVAGELEGPFISSLFINLTERQLIAQHAIVRVLHVVRVAEDVRGSGEHHAIVASRLNGRHEDDAGGVVLLVKSRRRGHLRSARLGQRGRRLITAHHGNGKNVLRIYTHAHTSVGDVTLRASQSTDHSGNLRHESETEKWTLA